MIAALVVAERIIGSDIGRVGLAEELVQIGAEFLATYAAGAVGGSGVVGVGHVGHGLDPFY
jgi:hypothetical protein